MKNLFLSFLVCAIGCMMASCTDSSSKQAEKIDESVKQFKSWDYKSYNGIYSATIYSDNYYVSDRGENLYGAITVITNGETIGSYLSIFTHGGDENAPKTEVLFPQTESIFIVSFDGSQLSTWSAFPSESGLTFNINYFEDWFNSLVSSKDCLINLNTTVGSMQFTFTNLNELQWNPQ